MYISPMALVVPLYLQMRKLHLTNTFGGIIIIYLGITLAFAIYLMTTYLKAIPEEIFEAAVIDGCGNTGILLRIILPLMKPGIMVVGVINFSVMWNDLLFAFIFLQKVERQTMMIALTSFRGAMGGGNMAYIMSSLLIATIPIMVIYLFTQKFFKEGMSMGAIK
jgi:ABC-type glycerol-3-phosphate transport system permease component